MRMSNLLSHYYSEFWIASRQKQTEQLPTLSWLIVHPRPHRVSSSLLLPKLNESN